MTFSGVSSDSETMTSGLRRSAACVLVALAAILLAGCAARRPPLVPPQGSPPAHGPAPESSKLPPAPPEAPALPGADRVYPSRDERNQAPAGAPEAFALPGPTVAARETGSVKTPASARASRESGLTVRPAKASKRAREGGSPALANGPAGSAGTTTVLSVQLFASSSRPVAERRAADLSTAFGSPCRVEKEGGVFKVRVGRFESRRQAEAMRRRALELGFGDAFIVARPRGGR
jgi:hypothetical protein